MEQTHHESMIEKEKVPNIAILSCCSQKITFQSKIQSHQRRSELDATADRLKVITVYKLFNDYSDCLIYLKVQ